MAAPSAAHEQRTLYVTITVTTVLVTIGIVWGVVVGSQMILLDGVYAFIEVVLSGLLVRASRLARQGPTRRFPYGREAATPLAIGFYGFVLAGTLLYAAVEAASTIRRGGSDFTPGWAIVFGVLTTVGSVATWSWLRSNAGDSDLMVAETAAWRVSSMRGLGMVVGFTAMALLTGSQWNGAVPYIDPVMVLITCVAFAPTPLRMMRTTVLELLEGNPDDSIRDAVVTRVEAVQSEFGLSPLDVLMTKVGPKLYVEVDGVVDGSLTVSEEHVIRRRLFAVLDELPYEIWLNAELVPHADD